MMKQLCIVALLAGSVTVGVPEAHAYTFPKPTSSTLWYVRLLGPSISLAGRDLNGTDLNGRILDGRYVEAVSFDGATRNQHPANSVWINRSRLMGLGGLYSNKPGQAVDARFIAVLDDGSTIGLRIDGAARHEAAVHHDVFVFDVSYETDAGWQPLCGLDATSGEPVSAIALQGRWSYQEGVEGGGSHIDDPDVFTFGCVNRAIGKCVLAGYKPWRRAIACSASDGCAPVSLADHHQACTRAMRADYCGDGISHTEDGMEINFYDSLDVRVDSLGWAVEAEWDAHGARCAVAERIDSTTPWCMQSLDDAACGQSDGFSSGSLIITEYDPQP